MSDYQDALQNPRLSFSDTELKRGIPVTDRLGLPKPVTGGFASVYQVLCDGRKWAVRCFLRYHQDTAQRYASIGRYLQDARLPYMAGFQFLNQGVRVRGQWYPVLKMEWVDGDPLNSYVERNRRDSQAMRRLADQFGRMTRDLRQANIAHGDLQHGNIMVVGGSLKLVDYDGMFVPPLRGMPSHEIGHPNYQHPRRSERDFGPYLDNFSEWVIRLSLVALSVRPDLWDLAGGGDEQLLFSQKDFVDPRSSRMLKALCEAQDGVLRELAAAFRSLLSCSEITQVPVIDGSRVAAPVPVRTHVVVGGTAQTAAAQKDNSLPEWVWDHMDAGQAEIGPPFVTERATVAAGLLLPIVLARFAGLHYLTPVVAAWGSVAGVVAAGVGLVVRYRAKAEFIRKSSLLVQVRGAKREIRRIEGAMRQMEREKNKLMQREDRSAGNLGGRLKDLEDQEREECDQIDAWLRRFIANLAEKREALNRAEADELALAAKSTPVLFLARRASGIVRHYRSKREPLLRQEERAKLEAIKKKDSIGARYARKGDPLRRKLQDVRQGFHRDRDSLDDRFERESQQVTLQKWSLQNLTRELTFYAKVSFVVFLRKVFFMKG